MPDSLSCVQIHFVFGTKNRELWIREEWESDLHRTIGAILSTKKCVLLAAGGASDHIHLLVAVGREVSQAEIMRVVKANTSKWIHETFPEYPFAWQVGYGSFGVSYGDIDVVKRYIARQKTHHATHSFRDEYRDLLYHNGRQSQENAEWDW